MSGKCIQMLENGAEVLYYCNDRALQSRCPKTSIIGRFTFLSDTALQSYTKRAKILQPLLTVRICKQVFIIIAPVVYYLLFSNTVQLHKRRLCTGDLQ